VGHLHAPVNATDHQAFFTPVELERLAQIALQGYEGVRLFALGSAPFPDEVSHATVATQVHRHACHRHARHHALADQFLLDLRVISATPITLVPNHQSIQYL